MAKVLSIWGWEAKRGLYIVQMFIIKKKLIKIETIRS